MNKRDFLKRLVTAITTVVLPLPSFGKGAAEIAETSLDGFVFQTAFFDFGHQLGVCITLPNGTRHAVRIRFFDTSGKSFKSKRIVERAILESKNELLAWAQTQYAKAA